MQLSWPSPVRLEVPALALSTQWEVWFCLTTRERAGCRRRKSNDVLSVPIPDVRLSALTLVIKTSFTDYTLLHLCALIGWCSSILLNSTLLTSLSLNVLSACCPTLTRLLSPITCWVAASPPPLVCSGCQTNRIHHLFLWVSTSPIFPFFMYNFGWFSSIFYSQLFVVHSEMNEYWSLCWNRFILWY